MDRGKVKALQADVKQALEKVAEVHGFVYEPGSMRYSDVDVTGRMQFVLTGKRAVVASQSNAHAINGLKVGDVVVVAGDAKRETYTIERFTPRGGSRIRRVRDGKGFRCPQVRLQPAGGKALAPSLTDAVIREIIRRTEPRLNKNAIWRLVSGWHWHSPLFGKGSAHPMPTTEAEVVQRLRDELKEADAEARKHPVPGMQWDGITMLNESADEGAAEAAMS